MKHYFCSESSQHMGSSSRASQRRGFTLIELLVVMVVVVVLGMIVMSVSGKAREASLKSESISRMRNLGIAFSLFAQDNNNNLPRERAVSPWGWRWMHQLLPYVNQQLSEAYLGGRINLDDVKDTGYFKCPSIEKVARGSNGVYLYNFFIDRPEGEAPINMVQLVAPEKLPILATADATCSFQIMFGADGQRIGPHPSASSSGYSGVTNRAGPAALFGNDAIFLFADGHVEVVDISDSNRFPWRDPSIFKPF